MLLEDEVRGTTVNCLLCAKSIRVDSSGSHNAPPGNKPAPAAAPPPRNPPAAAPPPQPKPMPPPVPAPTAQPPGDDKVIVTCPNPMCKSPLRVAASSRGTNLRCPKCKQVFKA